MVAVCNCILLLDEKKAALIQWAVLKNPTGFLRQGQPALDKGGSLRSGAGKLSQIEDPRWNST